MASRRDLAVYRQQQRDVAALAHADLVDFWRTVDVTDAADATRQLQAFVPELVADYGTVGADVAADFYDQLREQAPVRSTYVAAPSPPVPDDQARAVARWGAGPLFSANPDDLRALSMLAGGVQRLVAQPGRNTIADNAANDPAGVKWARAPSGPDPCAFCLMAASRGAVYHSEASAGGMNDWHSDCWCEPEPVFAGQSESYDVDALYDRYLKAAEKVEQETRARTGKPVLAEMRDTLGVR